MEFWHSAELVKLHAQNGPDLIVEMTTPLLNLLDTYKTRATFFVLGSVAEMYPELIEDIFERGHEIASHGYSHIKLHDLGKNNFENEISKSKKLLEKITGNKIKGFRAPTFSVDNDTIWALEILKKYNFVYDSSVFPVRTHLYGVHNAPLHPYIPSLSDLAVIDNSNRHYLIEVPLTVYKLGFAKIPISGGFYFRATPFFIFKNLFKKSLSSSNCNIIYLHPWELVPIFPRLNLPLCSRIITYYNIDTTMKKLKNLLNDFDFNPIEDIIYDLC